jgi:hypothetical protein
VLAEGGHYTMPGGTYKGYCWTFHDPGGSTIYPPCGVADADGGYPPCFTQATGLCVSASLRPGSANTWGGGLGCNLNQAAGTGTAALIATVAGMTSMTISVYGCAVPDQLQVQLNQVNPAVDDAGVKGSGWFCKLATLGPPDANGVRSVTVQLRDLVQDCWVVGEAGTPIGPVFDPETMSVNTIQAQVNSPNSIASNWDFCVSQWSIQ